MARKFEYFNEFFFRRICKWGGTWLCKLNSHSADGDTDSGHVACSRAQIEEICIRWNSFHQVISIRAATSKMNNSRNYDPILYKFIPIDSSQTALHFGFWVRDDRIESLTANRLGTGDGSARHLPPPSDSGRLRLNFHPDRVRPKKHLIAH